MNFYLKYRRQFTLRMLWILVLIADIGKWILFHLTLFVSSVCLLTSYSVNLKWILIDLLALFSRVLNLQTFNSSVSLCVPSIFWPQFSHNHPDAGHRLAQSSRSKSLRNHHAKIFVSPDSHREISAVWSPPSLTNEPSRCTTWHVLVNCLLLCAIHLWHVR